MPYMYLYYLKDSTVSFAMRERLASTERPFGLANGPFYLRAYFHHVSLAPQPYD